MSAVSEWVERGSTVRLGGHEIFMVDVPAEREEAEPVLVLHGFPSSSFDWRHVLPEMCRRRRVVLFDFLGHGLSAKPDQRYSLFEQADLAEAYLQHLEIDTVALVNHDMGDSVGGELLARELDGELSFTVTRRVLTNGSIYIDQAELSDGQQLLLALPDERLGPDLAPDGDTFRAGWGATFAPGTPASEEELDAQWELMWREGGNELLARIIRYIDERRCHEQRWTGAIERPPSPLTVVWGDADRNAGFTMAKQLCACRHDARLVRLRGIGHYPMIEAPHDFAAAMMGGLD